MINNMFIWSLMCTIVQVLDLVCDTNIDKLTATPFYSDKELPGPYFILE